MTQVGQIKPHGAIYGQTARSAELARAAVSVCKIFSTSDHQVAFIGLAGTAHQTAAEELGVRFIPGKSFLSFSMNFISRHSQSGLPTWSTVDRETF